MLCACFGTYEPADGESGSSSSTTTSSSSDTDGPLPSKVDLLILVDRRGEFESKAESLLPAFFQNQDAFVSSLTAVSSYHVGLTTMGPVPGNEDPMCRGIGSLYSAPEPIFPPSAELSRCDAILRGNRYVSSDEIPLEQIQAALECIFVGEPYPPEQSVEPRPIDAMQAALSDQLNAVGACNEGFFRPDAGLVILIATDRDETMNGDPPVQWFASLNAKQSVEFKDNIGLVLFVGLDPDGGGETDGDACEADYAPNLLEFARSRSDEQAARADICDPDAIIEAFGHMAETIIPDVANPAD